MVKVGILSKPDSWHSSQLAAAFNRLGVELVFAAAAQLCVRLGEERAVFGGEARLSDLDLLLVRHVPGGSLEQVIYRMDVLHQLEDSGVCLVNRPGAVEKMVDKYYTSSLLQKAGLLVPDTVLTEQVEEAVRAFDWLGGDVVVKPLFGSRGAGMVRLTDREVALRTFQALALGRYVFYLQRFIPHRCTDLRVLVVGGECIAAMERRGTTWKTNISNGAEPFAYVPEGEVCSASLMAAAAVGADYCGVDLLCGEDGRLYTVEVNSMPAWEGLQSVTPFSIADRIAAFCLSRMGS